ncbi:MAG: hypothetical protein VR73_00475 [Gammaproteobacteria bacterium BRH_c0]|nr:MAG: hypothetical protein VR73_00475 [Gammaproteobacteria bacterium BRH_c0]
MRAHTTTGGSKRPALRLVSTRNLPRADWLAVRRQGIGASDSAAAVGLNPYQSPLELWLVKTGRDANLPVDDPNDESSPMYWGTILEPIVAAHYTKRTGRKVRRVNSVLRHPDPDKAWMIANLDYSITGDSQVQLLECKTAGEYGARLWREGVPEYIQCQVQHQLAVTGKAAADVCVLICGQEIQIHRIERDEALIANLIALERRFWNYVISDTPPPADGSDSSARALQCLFPQDNGDTLDLATDSPLCAVFDALVSTREEIGTLERVESDLKQTIQQTLGDATKAVFHSGYVTWKRSKDSHGLDVATLLKDNPHLLNQYPLVKPGSRRFLVKT